MNKPTPYVKEAIDYGEAAKWVGDKLGYDIRDVNSCSDYDFADPNRPKYLDYWHYIINNQEVHNGGTIYIDKYMLEFGEDWQNKITQCFIDEFGDEQEYWTDW